uniref:Vacuolar protein-sorting-associated protein 36 n=1 Tax=Hirondellea gigas TaxID=1518452 RepID=A0A2P2I3J5_9CRUS
MDRWYWTASTYLPGEIAKYSCNCKRLYDGDNKTGYEDGHLTVTSIRLLWKHSSNNKSLGLSLSIVVLVEEESGGFMSSGGKIVLHLTSTPAEQPSGPFGTSPHSHIKLGLKHSDLSTCTVQLRAAVSDKVWESGSFRNMVLSDVSSSNNRNKPARAGILGIERAIEAKQQATSQSISVAFEDLKQLMTQAKAMVKLSHSIAARLKDQDTEASADETTQFRSCLLSLGIDDPVTREAVGSTSQYHKKLAEEISQTLETSVREVGGVMLLSEVYCRINRARGLHLVSPEDVANACSIMTSSRFPLNLYSFESGVQVLQLTTLDTKTLVSETRELLERECGGRDGGPDGKWKGVSAGELGRMAGLPLMLAKERLLLCEKNGAALRDESSEGLQFFPNYFDQLST